MESETKRVVGLIVCTLKPRIFLIDSEDYDYLISEEELRKEAQTPSLLPFTAPLPYRTSPRSQHGEHNHHSLLFELLHHTPPDCALCLHVYV